jgi:RNA polymerase sigma-70 factor, ECF subfamily
MTTTLAVDVGTDERLVEALRAGDEHAFQQLLDPTAAVAEEVVQDTWVAVLDGIDRFRGASSLKTWIFRILVNRATTRGVRERRSVPFSCLTPTEQDEGPTVSADRFTADGSWAVAPRPFELPEDRVQLLELRERLREALAELPERQRIVVGLRDVEGLSSDEVCDLLDLSAENQRVLLHRGRARLAALLAGYQAG